ncbi:cytochrome C assembly family protein [Granulicella tundricola]|uniref:Cytochrome c assembly protein n=1 Tax=Granulicella tundricola (strain ATCC BAA-1859 / DSM 23138 / MP5ACTX9) TaxID=1198114 RepID=E8X353_GRATM|nr:cytochrome c biogenesis protein CcsA [Granulicella tundricola]ADW69277.1 cytochrome c assembly protein [Granulicella tundricola MP5ACTX9]
MSLLWLRVAVLLYGIAALAVLPAALYDRHRWRHIAIPATVLALIFHFVSFAETLSAAHHALPVDTHETLSLIGILLALAFLIVYWRYRTLALGIFILPVVFLLGLLPAFHPGEELVAPGLHAGWVLLHIALLLAAYVALLISLIASLLYLIQERRLKSKSVAKSSIKLPPLDTLDRLALRALTLGLPCMTAGLLIGSALAQVTYGSAYFRDPKILLAFAMWLAYIGMIYIRRHSGLRGRRAVYLSSFTFFIILAVWASNQFSAVHRFTTP